MWIPADLYILKALIAGHAYKNIYLYDYLKKNSLTFFPWHGVL